MSPRERSRLRSVSGFSFNVYTGEVSESDKMQMVDDFQDPEKDHFILLISTQAGGVGLNLTAANKVVIFDPDWSECIVSRQPWPQY